MWYQKFGTYIQQLGFTRSQADHCVYSRKVGKHFIFVVLYVEDMLLVDDNMDLIKDDLKVHLSSKFDMKDLGQAHFILGMEIKRNQVGIRLWLIRVNMLSLSLKY